MSRDERLYIDDMLEACLHIASFVAVTDAARFETDRLFQAAIERELFILGEAAKHVSPETRALHPQVPWKQTAGLRDVLGHDYFGLDNAAIWRIATVNVPVIVAQLRAIVDHDGC